MITIRVINPNTTASMTDTIREAAQAVAGPDTRIVATNPSMGPVSIESHYDEALASVGVLDEVRQGEQEGADGYVLACFGDPGLHAAQELASGPVVGIAAGGIPRGEPAGAVLRHRHHVVAYAGACARPGARIRVRTPMRSVPRLRGAGPRSGFGSGRRIPCVARRMRVNHQGLRS